MLRWNVEWQPHPHITIDDKVTTNQSNLMFLQRSDNVKQPKCFVDHCKITTEDQISAALVRFLDMMQLWEYKALFLFRGN